MIAKSEWFVAKTGFTGKVHLIPIKLAGWLYYLVMLITLFVAQAVYSPLVIVVILIFVIDMIQVAVKQRKK